MNFQKLAALSLFISSSALAIPFHPTSGYQVVQRVEAIQRTNAFNSQLRSQVVNIENHNSSNGMQQIIHFSDGSKMGLDTHTAQTANGTTTAFHSFDVGGMGTPISSTHWTSTTTNTPVNK